MIPPAISYDAIPVELKSCENEVYAIDDPTGCDYSRSFPYFKERFEWTEFIYEPQTLCVVDRYKVTITDVKNRKYVFKLEWDSI